MIPLTELAHAPASVAAIVALGAALTAGAIHTTLAGLRIPRVAPTHLDHWLTLVKALRLALTGVCLMVLGAGLHLGTAALIVPAVVIGLEELYETTMVVTVLERARVGAAGEGGEDRPPRRPA